MPIWVRWMGSDLLRGGGILLAMAATFTVVLVAFGAAGACAALLAEGRESVGPVVLLAFVALPGALSLAVTVGIGVARWLPDARLDVLRGVAMASGLQIVHDDGRLFAAQGTHRGRAMRLEQTAMLCLFGPPTLIVGCEARGYATFVGRTAAGSDPAWVDTIEQDPAFLELVASGRGVHVVPEHVHVFGALGWLADAETLTARIGAVVDWTERLEQVPPPTNPTGTRMQRLLDGFGPSRSTTLADWVRLTRFLAPLGSAAIGVGFLTGATVGLVLVAVG